jgi:hypothetical protein
MDASKPIKASELLENLDLLRDIAQNYILLSDSSLGGTFLKMIEVINILDEYGWETVSISNAADGMTMYALVRRRIKGKNEA